ncbi:MAG: alanine racemase [Gammaproteobacteria bacterium]|nr:alanine racemase [Gammaproteobacteria bacterium]
MRPSHALVDLGALRRNLRRAVHLAPGSKNVAVVKANGYGHGMVEAARALGPEANALAVATLEEAVALREADIAGPVLVLQGPSDATDIEEAAVRDFWLMVHEPGQAERIAASKHGPIQTWLKIDSGMHRLGFLPDDAAAAIDRLVESSAPDRAPVLCTHLACADDLDSPTTEHQLRRFETVARAFNLQRSIANSAGIMHWPASHADWNRPGIMLYGCEPTGTFGNESELEAVMTVRSEIIAVREIAAGEGVGYGHRWTAERPARIGTVSIGYGDGYPRHAPNGTPVWVNGERAPLAGTVSMDMITVDLTGRDDVRVGDPVELWGPNLPVAEVAQHAGTIGYDLLAGMTSRLPRIYVNESAGMTR